MMVDKFKLHTYKSQQNLMTTSKIYHLTIVFHLHYHQKLQIFLNCSDNKARIKTNAAKFHLNVYEQPTVPVKS